MAAMKTLYKMPRRRIYADAAAATPIHPRVLRRLTKLLQIYANPGALHKEAVEAKRELERARKEIAEAIGAHADEIIFTASGTEANNLALIGTLHPLLRQHGNLHAITIAIEHQSILEPLRHLTKYGLSLTELPVDAEGFVSPKALAEAIRPDTAFISIQLVNSEVGTIEPLRECIKEVRRIRKERAAAGSAVPLFVHTDACQAPLYVPIRVEALGADLMTLDGQKVLGPKGVGALYQRRGTPLESVIFGGRQERGLRGGTENAPLAGAFAEALSMAQKGVEKRAAKVARVRDALIRELKRLLPETQVNGPLAEEGSGGPSRVANNLNISIPGLEGETGVIALDALGVAVSTRSACVTKDEEPSHVIKALGHSRERAREAIRITLLPDASERDAKQIAAALGEACRLYRKK